MSDPEQLSFLFSFDDPARGGEEKSLPLPASVEPVAPKVPEEPALPKGRGVKREQASARTGESHGIRGVVLDGDLTGKSRELILGLGMEELADEVRVHWNSRLRTTAGFADANKQTVMLNPRLLDLPGDEVDVTLRHELAHLVAYRKAGTRRIQAHGTEWKAACVALGIPNEPRCHNLPFEARRQRPKFAYQCVHCKEVYPRVRKIKWQSACYACCRKHNRGRFSKRYLLKQVSLDLLLEADGAH